MTSKTPEEPVAADGLGPFLRRVAGVLQLQNAAYAEVAADPAATQQAAVVVALSALAQALGGPEHLTLTQIPLALALAYFSWLVPGTLVWVVGTRFLAHRADLPRVLRSVGFATAPQLLWLVGLLAFDSRPFYLALGVLIFALALIASVLAIRHAFAIDTLRAVQTFLLGFLAFAGVALVASLVLAPFAAEA